MSSEKSTTIKILIFGSCVSRDIFNFKNHFHLTGYYARSSFASISQTPFTDFTIAQRLKSDFQRNMVITDMKKSFWDELKRNDFDILLLDFIDSRFNLLNIDQTICTLSNEAVSTGFLDEYREKKIIQSTSNWFFIRWINNLKKLIIVKENNHNKIILHDSNEFLQMWEEGWEEFIIAMKSTNNLDKIILNKVYLATETLSTNGFGSSYPKHKILGMNIFLDQLYSIAEQSIPSENIMSFSKDLMVGADEHQWGKSPFHYVTEYYLSALNFLDNWNGYTKK